MLSLCFEDRGAQTEQHHRPAST